MKYYATIGMISILMSGCSTYTETGRRPFFGKDTKLYEICERVEEETKEFDKAVDKTESHLERILDEIFGKTPIIKNLTEKSDGTQVDLSERSVLLFEKKF